MTHDKRQYHRRSIRLKGYDYTQVGAYFITICTHNRTCVFGEVVDGMMRLNEYGVIVREEWFRSAVLRPYLRLLPEEFVVMPNHVHGIIWIVDDVGARRCRAPTLEFRAPTPTAERFGKPVPGSIPTIVRAFKSAVTKRINDRCGTAGAPVWQRNYYEHVIRTEESLERIREYILTNPLRWHLDRENLHRTGNGDLWDSLLVSAQGDRKI
jgi:REP element-mobilizing transposase RayT